MKEFKDFGLKPIEKNFIGDKIKMDRILNREIIIHAYRVDKSKVDSGTCLTMQIEIVNEKRIVFTSGKFLTHSLNQIPKDGFPFKTTIVKQDWQYEFS